MAACRLLLAGLLTELLALPPLAASTRYTTMPSSALSKAMLGVDPMIQNSFDAMGLALRDPIFVPSSSFRDCEGTIQLNDFIGRAEQDVRCNRMSLSSVKTAWNFNSYKKMMSESFSVAKAVGIPGEFEGFSDGAHVGYTSFPNSYGEKHLEFYQKTGGEIVHGTALCQTHVVSVNLISKPIFAENFLTGLKKLNLAAQNPSSFNSVETFRQFVHTFGTHFQDKTIFGSKVIIQKLFVNKSASTAENTQRQRCVASSFNQNFQAYESLVQAEHNFKQDANKCSESPRAANEFNSLGLSSERIITIGTLPSSDPNTWAENALKNPVPIHYELKKISDIFVQGWFENVLAEENLNGTAMRDFFENLSQQYCEITLGASCTSTRVGCGYNSNCRLEEKCIDDQSTDGFTCEKGCGHTSDCPHQTVCVNDDSLEGFHCEPPCSSKLHCSADEACHVESHSNMGYICVPTKSGKAVIVGGEWHVGDLYKPIKEVDCLNCNRLPNLPQALRFGAMAKAGDYVYLCGGLYQESDGNNVWTDDCVRISVKYPGDEWEQMQSAPFEVSYQSAVSIGDTVIWFFSGPTLAKFNSETNAFSTTRVPFIYGGCSVGNGTHVYIIGAGKESNEIWTNKNSMDESEWQLAKHLDVSLASHACLWYGSNVMIAGGRPSKRAVRMFNTETWQVWRGEDLPYGVHAHSMMLHDGMPTVVGGFTTEYSNRFLSFSITDNQWAYRSVNLTSGKAYFALAEV